MGYGCPVIRKRGGLSLPDPARRSRRPVPSRACRRCPPVPALRGNSTAGLAVGLPLVLGFSCFSLGFLSFLSFPEKLCQRVRRRFWPVRPVAFSLCVVFSFVSLESRPRLLFQPESSPLYLGNLPARGKNADLGGLVFLLFPFILFIEKAGEENYYFLEGLIAWLIATELESFVTADCKAALKVRNTPSKRTSCTTFKKRKDSLVPEIKFIPVVDVTWAVFLSWFSFYLFIFPHPLKVMRSKVPPTCSACLLRYSLRCTCPV